MLSSRSSCNVEFSCQKGRLHSRFQYIFNSRDPIVMGVMVEAGIVKEGTPLCVPSKDVRISLSVLLFACLVTLSSTRNALHVISRLRVFTTKIHKISEKWDRTNVTHIFGIRLKDFVDNVCLLRVHVFENSHLAFLIRKNEKLRIYKFNIVWFV